MDNFEIDQMINQIRGHKVWKTEFKDLFDVLDNGLMKIEIIPQAHTSIVNLNLTSSLIVDKANFFLKQFDLSIPQKNVLEALFYCKRDLTQAELSKFVFSSKSNMSTLLNRVEEKGFIRRYENSKNKREKLIKLTRKGENKLRELFSANVKVVNELISNLITEEEGKQLNKILFKLRKGFENLEINGG